MRNLKLTLAYDGTEYHGWQIQPNVPTIQGAMQTALGKLFNHDVSVQGSGRTDAGVHARGQVANVYTVRSMDTDAVLRGVNALLPSQIRVWEVEEVGLEFHAGKSAVAKTYEYHIWRTWIVSPFQCRYVHVVPYRLDADAIDEASRCFAGTHDFTSFCAAASEVEDKVRTVYSAEWDRSPDEWLFRIRGSGFLQYMVRTIVGTLLYVGAGKVRPDSIPEILARRDRRLAGPSAPACGLHLASVEY